MDESEHFTLAKTWYIRLGWNRIRTLSTSVLRTFNTTVRPINLETYSPYASFCQGRVTCDCCDAREFAQWLKDNNRSLSAIDVECGTMRLKVATLHILNLDEPCVEHLVSPHPSCSYSVSRGLGVDCKSVTQEVVLNDIDLFSISSAILNLSISNMVYNTDEFEDEPEFPQLPEKQNLTTVDLEGHRAWLTDLTVFPFHWFLTNNRRTIKNLRLSYLNLARLSESDFHGFNLLENIDLDHCLIRNIDVNAFQTLAAAPGPTFATLLSHMRFVRVSNNNILQLDWCFLEPVSHSLEVSFFASIGFLDVILRHFRNRC